MSVEAYSGSGMRVEAAQARKKPVVNLLSRDEYLATFVEPMRRLDLEQALRLRSDG